MTLNSFIVGFAIMFSLFTMGMVGIGMIITM